MSFEEAVRANKEPTNRYSKALTSLEVDTVLYGVPFIDSRYQYEIQSYLKEMILSITTGDEQYDLRQLSLYA